MLRKCSIVNSYMRTRNVIYRMSAFLSPSSNASQYNAFGLSWSAAATDFLADRRLFTIFGWSSKYSYIYYFQCSLASTFTLETQVSSLFTRTMWCRNLLHVSSITPRSFSQRSSHCVGFVSTHEQFRNTSWAELIITKVNYDNLLEKVNSICENLHKISEIVKGNLSENSWSSLWNRSSLNTNCHPKTSLLKLPKCILFRKRLLSLTVN